MYVQTKLPKAENFVGYTCTFVHDTLLYIVLLILFVNLLSCYMCRSIKILEPITNSIVVYVKRHGCHFFLMKAYL